VPGTVYEFGEFRLDCDRFELRHAGRSLKLEKKAMELLILMAARNGHLVTRTEIAERLWGPAVFVDTEHGINTAIRKIRQALRDDPAQPRFLQTVTGMGYRFLPVVVVAPNGAEAANRNKVALGAILTEDVGSPPSLIQPDPGVGSHSPPARKWLTWVLAAGVCGALALIGMALYPSRALRPAQVQFTQLTDFTDSALAPALSPDGRMLAFIRGNSGFLSADQIYMKLLPDGEARRLTEDPRLKYDLAFSPDGSQIAYTVLVHHNWETYTVSVLGGDSHLLLDNAAGLSWLDQHQLLFSQVRSGMHLGIVTGTVTRANFRELYFPAHERGMAHYSYASPDRRSALVVEMNEHGGWAPCRLISLAGSADTRAVGPPGSCTSAGWSPDGSWMYFTAAVDGRSHLWRQHYPYGQPEQITFGPTEEDGVAVERDGRSVITSMGVEENAIWFHDPDGERSLSSEGEIVADLSPPSFDAEGKLLYYLLRHRAAGSGPELWRMMIDSGKAEPVFPGTAMLAFDVSPDGKEVVYSTSPPGKKAELWLARIDKSAPAKRICSSGELQPHFGPRGQILFLLTEGKFNYLEQMNPDGSGRSKVVSYPISEVDGISPGRRWVMAIIPYSKGNGGEVAPVAIPLDGGAPRVMCAGYCVPVWSPNGKFLFVPVEAPTRTGPGRSLAIPVGPGESLPEFPAGGIKPMADPGVVPGSQSVMRGELVPGNDPSHFAYVNTTGHRNLYRISLP
jgi:DNA-binding winged helix-turn-helix (wHTH) protein/Tol biopolymer transport system component